MNVVLIEPEIHWNTGNIGRTCLAAGATLHLVGPLGFELDDKRLRRAGLDYWPRVDLRIHPDFESFLGAVPEGAPLLFFSAQAEPTFWEAPYRRGAFLVFGKESTGLPTALRRRFRARTYRIPQSRAVRSLNLSTAAGIVLYEALRRTSGRIGGPLKKRGRMAP